MICTLPSEADKPFQSPQPKMPNPTNPILPLDIQGEDSSMVWATEVLLTWCLKIPHFHCLYQFVGCKNLITCMMLSLLMVRSISSSTATALHPLNPITCHASFFVFKSQSKILLFQYIMSIVILIISLYRSSHHFSFYLRVVRETKSSYHHQIGDPFSTVLLTIDS